MTGVVHSILSNLEEHKGFFFSPPWLWPVPQSPQVQCSQRQDTKWPHIPWLPPEIEAWPTCTQRFINFSKMLDFPALGIGLAAEVSHGCGSHARSSIFTLSKGSRLPTLSESGVEERTKVQWKERNGSCEIMKIKFWLLIIWHCLYENTNFSKSGLRQTHNSN